MTLSYPESCMSQSSEDQTAVASLPGLSDTRLEEIAGQINRAHDMVSALCHGTREWVLSIPAEPERDPDLVIGDGLQAGRDLFREVRRLQGAIRQHEEDEASVCPEDVGFVEYIRALESQLASAREETAQAVRAEREACAKIAQGAADIAYLHPQGTPQDVKMAESIAKAIRSRSHPAGGDHA